jgi:hypothetical protein
MKPEAILSKLEKLYAKRKALDKQISETEKDLAGSVKAASGAALKKPAGRKPRAGKTAASPGVRRGRKPKIQVKK